MVAKTFLNLGNVQWALGEQREAFTNVERALAIYAAAYGSDHGEYAKVLMILSVFQARVWKLRDALTSLKRAIPVLRAIDERYRPVRVETKIDWRFIKQQKIFAFVYFVLYFYATVRTSWPTARGHAN